MKHLILHILAVAVSLATASGVMIHDSRFDKAMDGHLSWKTDNQPMKYDSGSHPKPHVHPEHFNNSALRGSRHHNPNPSYPPREQRLKKYVVQNIEPRGRHAFDNHHLPVVS